jgi:hypothetical protein
MRPTGNPPWPVNHHCHCHDSQFEIEIANPPFTEVTCMSVVSSLWSPASNAVGTITKSFNGL